LLRENNERQKQLHSRQVLSLRPSSLLFQLRQS